MTARHLLAAAWISTIALGLIAASAPTTQPPTSTQPNETARHPDAIRAEAAFFHALNQDPSQRDQALRTLTAAYLADPDDGATNLWLGMAHLWVLAESPVDSPDDLNHTLLARHFLERARRLIPDDSRIPSWLSPVHLHIAEIENDPAAAADAEAQLLAALRADPIFHSVSVGMVRWDNPPESLAFREGLAAMRAGLDAAPDDPSALNHPRWPYNVEGFTLAMADYELKAGNRQVATVLLTSIRERPGYDEWPHKPQVEARMDTLHALARRYADADPANDPPSILGRASGVSCVVCHQGPTRDP